MDFGKNKISVTFFFTNYKKIIVAVGDRTMQCLLESRTVGYSVGQ